MKLGWSASTVIAAVATCALGLAFDRVTDEVDQELVGGVLADAGVASEVVAGDCPDTGEQCPPECRLMHEAHEGLASVPSFPLDDYLGSRVEVLSLLLLQ